MDLSKLTSRKFLMGGGALAWTMLQEESDPNRLAAMTAIAVTYLLVEGLKDWLAVKQGPKTSEGQ